MESVKTVKRILTFKEGSQKTLQGVPVPQVDENGTLTLNLRADDEPITFTDLKEIGRGYNAIVYCCIVYPPDQVENRAVVKLARGESGMVSIRVEGLIYRSLQTVGIPVIPIIGRQEGVIVRPLLKKEYFGDQVKMMTPVQLTMLQKLWKRANEFALVTGIPLDLTPENIWWDELARHWLIVDTGPRLDDDDDYKFGYTLDSNTFEEYIHAYYGDHHLGTYFATHKLSPTTQRVFLTKRDKGWALMVEFKKLIIPDSKPIMLKMIGEDYVNYNEEKKRIQAHIETLASMAVANPEKKREFFLFLQGFPVTQRVTQIVRSDIYFSEELCDRMGICAVAQPNSDMSSISDSDYESSEDNSSSDEFTAGVETIKKLRNDTTSFFDQLPDEYKTAVGKYTGASYTEMNNCMRGSKSSLLECKKVGPTIVPDIILLDELLSDAYAPQIDKEVTVFRGIAAEADATSQKVAKALKALRPGDLWEDRGFVSTSIQHPPWSFVGNTCCIMEIHLPRGTTALYIGTASSSSSEEEVILLPGITLQFLEKREGNAGINFRMSRHVDTYVFKCVHCTVFDRYTISDPPKELQWAEQIMQSKLPFQPQDVTVGMDRLGFFHMTESYNAYIPENSRGSLRVVTWNVHEWRSKDGTKTEPSIEAALTDVINGDVLCLQEVSGKQAVIDRMYRAVSCDADPGSYGEKLRNEIWVKRGIQVLNSNVAVIGFDRCVSMVKLYSLGQTWVVANLHLDVNSSKRRVENIQRAMQAIQDFALETDQERLSKPLLSPPPMKELQPSIIVAGDFNSYRTQDYDEEQFANLVKLKEKLPDGMDIFESVGFMEAAGFTDSFVARGKKLRVDNIHPVNTNFYGGRVDFIFLAPETTVVNGSFCYYSTLSDHVAIVADFSPATGSASNKYERLVDFPSVTQRPKDTAAPPLQQKSKADLALEKSWLIALENGNLLKVEDLIAKGMNVNGLIMKNLPLNIAIEEGHVELVKLLMENGATLSSKLAAFNPAMTAGYKHSPNASHVSQPMAAIYYYVVSKATPMEKRNIELGEFVSDLIVPNVDPHSINNQLIRGKARPGAVGFSMIGYVLSHQTNQAKFLPLIELLLRFGERPSKVLKEKRAGKFEDSASGGSGEWVCTSCGAENSASATICDTCMVTNPSPSIPIDVWEYIDLADTATEKFAKPLLTMVEGTLSTSVLEQYEEITNEGYTPYEVFSSEPGILVDLLNSDQTAPVFEKLAAAKHVDENGQSMSVLEALVNVPNLLGVRAVTLAAANGFFDISRVLLEAGAKESHYFNGCLVRLLEQGGDEVEMDQIIDNKAFDPNAGGYYDHMLVVAINKPYIVNRLLEKGANPKLLASPNSDKTVWQQIVGLVNATTAPSVEIISDFIMKVERGLWNPFK